MTYDEGWMLDSCWSARNIEISGLCVAPGDRPRSVLSGCRQLDVAMTELWRAMVGCIKGTVENCLEEASCRFEYLYCCMLLFFDRGHRTFITV